MKKILQLKLVALFTIILVLKVNGQIQFKKTIGTQYNDFPTNILKNSENDYLFGVVSFPYNGFTKTKLYKLTEEGTIANENAISKPDTNTKLLNISRSFDENHYFGAGHLKYGDTVWLWLFTFDQSLNVTCEKKVQMADTQSIDRADVLIDNFEYYISYYRTNQNNLPITEMCKYLPSNDSIIFSEWDMPAGHVFDLEKNPHNENILFGGYVLDRTTFATIWEVSPQLELINKYDTLPHDIYHLMDLEWLKENQLIYGGTYYNSEYNAEMMGIQILDSSMQLQHFNSFGNENYNRNYVSSFNSIALNNENNIYFGGTYNVSLFPFPNLENHLALHKLDTNLNTEWSYLLGGDAYYLMYSIAPAAGEGCVVAATRYDSEIQNQERDVYLVGLGPDGL
ncbi:MAG: hypothetical protein K9J27_13270, partial [Bacteroidales bacterium]|nr:hypothetical protein [Bacteroidales bacterium]